LGKTTKLQELVARSNPGEGTETSNNKGKKAKAGSGEKCSRSPEASHLKKPGKGGGGGGFWEERTGPQKMNRIEQFSLGEGCRKKSHGGEGGMINNSQFNSHKQEFLIVGEKEDSVPLEVLMMSTNTGAQKLF